MPLCNFLFFYNGYGHVIEADAVQLSMDKRPEPSVYADFILMDGVEPYIKTAVAVDVT